MITELQRQYCRSRFFRRGMLDALEASGCPVRGFRREWYDIFVFAFERLPEPYIKAQLYGFLQCRDVTAADRAEILRLLQLSSTALTKRQQRRLHSFLQE